MKTRRMIGLAAAGSLLLCMHATSARAGWLKRIYGNGNDAGGSIARSADGSYVVAGLTDSDNTPGEYDAVLWKLNSNGELGWWKSLEGPLREEFTSVTPASGGGYIAFGFSISTSVGGIDLLMAKFDASGGLQWQRVFRCGSQGAGSMISTSDGGYVLCGSAETTGTSLDALLVKTDGAGNISWARTWTTSTPGSTERGFSVIQTTDGGYFVAGHTEVSGPFDGLLMKLDGAGNLVWSTTASYTAAAATELIDAIETTDGGFVCVGHTMDFSYNYAGCAMKVSGSGSLEWQRVWDSSFIDMFKSVERASGSDLVLIGSGADEAVVVRIDASGVPIWQKAYGTAHPDGGLGIVSDGAGGFVISAGSSWSGAGLPSDLLMMSIDGNGWLGADCTPWGWEYDISAGSTVTGLNYSALTLTETANTMTSAPGTLSTDLPAYAQFHHCGDASGEANLNGAWTKLKKNGSNVRGTVSVRNNGSLDAGSFVVSIYFSRKPVVTSKSVLFSTSPVTGLAAGGSTTLKVNATPPKRSKYVIAVIDSYADIVESDESDNIASRAY